MGTSRAAANGSFIAPAAAVGFALRAWANGSPDAPPALEFAFGAEAVVGIGAAVAAAVVVATGEPETPTTSPVFGGVLSRLHEIVAATRETSAIAAHPRIRSS